MMQEPAWGDDPKTICPTMYNHSKRSVNETRKYNADPEDD